MERVQDPTDEDVAREKSLLDLLPPVLAAAPYFELGEKGKNSLIFQALEDHFFMPAPGVEAIPEGMAFGFGIAHDSLIFHREGAKGVKDSFQK